MKNSLLISALCAITFGFVCGPVRAQDAPLANAQAATPGGYALLLQARELLLPGPNGSPAAAEKLAPAENLRRQRLAVARTAPALAKVRAALKLGIAVPATEFENFPDFRVSAASREFARQFAQEAAVRAADGDARGAAQSSLDSLELGAQFGRGSLIQWLTGTAIMSIARQTLLQYAPALDAAQSREVAASWAAIDRKRPTFEQILDDEQAADLRMRLSTFVEPKNRAHAEAELRDQPETPDNRESRQDMRVMLALSPAQLATNNQQVFDAARARAKLPYQIAAKAAPLQSADPYSGYSAQLLSGTRVRFIFERDVVANRLAVAALRLRAAKLESGAYPETFDAGTDPFSPTVAPLVYKRAGDSYILYSVGPDGKDNDGGEIQTLITDDETGVKSVSGRLTPVSTGDIVASVL